MRRRTSVSGLLASRNFRTASRSWSCSSEKAKFTERSLSAAPTVSGGCAACHARCERLHPAARPPGRRPGRGGPPLPGLPREAEHPLADDVALDLARARVDRLRPADHEDAVELVDRVVAARVAGHELRV